MQEVNKSTQVIRDMKTQERHKPQCWARMGLLMTVKRERDKSLDTEMDTKTDVQGAPTNQEKTFLTDYMKEQK